MNATICLQWGKLSACQTVGETRREDLRLADVTIVANLWLWCGRGGSSVQERCGGWVWVGLFVGIYFLGLHTRVLFTFTAVRCLGRESYHPIVAVYSQITFWLLAGELYCGVARESPTIVALFTLVACNCGYVRSRPASPVSVFHQGQGHEAKMAVDKTFPTLLAHSATRLETI